MATLTDLQNAISQLLDLPGIAAILQLNSATRERAFEAYVFSLLVVAVREAGGAAVIHGIRTGPNPSVIVFRGGPGLLGSQVQDFAFASCQLGNKEFEIHVGVQYEGGSEAVHEIDVSLFDRDAANRLRQSPNSFAKVNKLYGAVECKFYDSTLGTVLGRTFVGLVDDCGTLQLKLFSTNGLSQGLAKYFSPRTRPNRFFRLSPTQPRDEREFINFVRHTLSEWASVA
jgi:hypothetical protein